MFQGDDQERTERATPKRREDARRKGQTANSREITSVLILCSALAGFVCVGSDMFQDLSELMRMTLNSIGTLSLDDVSSRTFIANIIRGVIIAVLPFMAIIVCAGIAANLVQVGFLFTTEPLTPKLSRLSPLNGMKKFISLRSVEELLKSVMKLGVVGGIAFLIVEEELVAFPSLMQVDVKTTLSAFGRISVSMCFYICLALLFMAGVDYASQRWHHEKSLRMTKQEIKEEFKQREGDPFIKARVRSIQAEMARRRMMEAVREADVVITNPTRLAVALQYSAESMVAPKVVGKGADFIADRIRKIAQEVGIPIVENKPLAQVIFKAVQLNDYIPPTLYRAVAEILAYVYRLKGMGK
ncbi:MAG: flagellar biosynthesis protein FlhB [Deltaproteobacteria bacterium]|nr:flagellar biosynthesis protein FlhB [Deltaproteobacteria bacterium]